MESSLGRRRSPSLSWSLLAVIAAGIAGCGDAPDDESMLESAAAVGTGLKLHAATVVGTDLQITYDKASGGCVDLLEASAKAPSPTSAKRLCPHGSKITVAAPLGSFPSVAVGRHVKLCTRAKTSPACTEAVLTTATHPVDFHLPSRWANLPDIRERLSGYVDDINVVFARGTVRRFVLGEVHARDRSSDVGEAGIQKYPLDPGYTYAVVVDDRVGSFGASHGGYSIGQIAGRGRENELSAVGIHWKDVWSAADLKDPLKAADHTYRQVTTLVHEFGHFDGLGSGEYYNLSATDSTDVAPRLDLTWSPVDPYWSTRAKVLNDPMLFCGSFTECQFSPLGRLLILRAANGYGQAHGCPPGQPACTALKTHPALRVAALKKRDGGAIKGCAVKVFGRGGYGGPVVSTSLVAQGTTDAAGHFDFESRLEDNNLNDLHLIKVSCAGAAPQASWISHFDLQAFQQGIPGGGAKDDFHYPGEVTFSF